MKIFRKKAVKASTWQKNRLGNSFANLVDKKKVREIIAKSADEEEAVDEIAKVFHLTQAGATSCYNQFISQDKTVSAKQSDAVEGSIDDIDWEDETADENGYIKLATKKVPDADGFLTEYTLYTDPDRSIYFCMFGDSDVYGPDPDYADADFETEEEAYEWFDDYSGIDEDVYGQSDIMCTMYIDRGGIFGEDNAVLSEQDLRDYWAESKEYDPTLREYQSYHDWLKDSQEFLEKLDEGRLWTIADRYSSSTPVSGNWDTEVQHEQKAIADEFGISLDGARRVMLHELVFDPNENFLE